MDSRIVALVGSGLLCACGGAASNAVPGSQPVPSSSNLDAADPSPAVTFVQVARSVGIERRREPASAGPYTDTGTCQYGSWLADLDGDGRLDYYAVNHGQFPHLSGLFVNGGSSGFGQNLFTVALEPAPEAERWARLDLSNEMGFVGDLNGDGRVDLFFIGWSDYAVLCVNQGNGTGPDWSGPRFHCYGTTEPVAFGDVNGDGRIDVLAVGQPGLDPYDAYRSNTSLFVWRLNNGNADIETWPTTDDFLGLRVADPGSPAPPFLDLNGDAVPDKIVEIPLPPANRGPYGTWIAGLQVFLGQATGGYALQAATGLEAVTVGITAVEDVDGDGCLDVGTDETGYRDNQEWYVQDRVDGRCGITFHHVPRTQLPYYPGFRRYAVDVDNSGLLSQVVIVHGAYGNNDGQPVGVTINRRLLDGTYVAIPPAESGIDLTNGGTEFYADNLSPGDWDDDGRVDLAGTGVATIPGTDSGFALWTSRLSSSNGWIKISLPTVTGFFVGSAAIEVFDAGFVGDPSRLATPARRLYAGRTWGSQVHHLGIGMRAAVDVRVTFPDGRVALRTGVTPGSRLVIEPGSPPLPDTQPPTAPTGLAAAASGTQVNLSWTASTDDVGVTGYRVERCQGAGCTGFAQVGTTTATTYADPGLLAGTTYVYRVRATDAAGNLSGYSGTASATTAAAPPVIAFVQVAAATPQTPQTSVAVRYAAAQVAGDLNVVVVGWNDSTATVTSVVDGSGNTYVKAVGPTIVSGRLTQSIYYARNIAAAAAGANTVTVGFSVAALYVDVRILEYSGIDPANPVDVTAAASGTSTAADSGAATTTNAYDLIFGAATTTTGARAGTGFTSRIVTTPNEDLAEDRTVSATGGYRATARVAPRGAWVMQMVAFRGASGSGP